MKNGNHYSSICLITISTLIALFYPAKSFAEDRTVIVYNHNISVGKRFDLALHEYLKENFSKETNAIDTLEYFNEISRNDLDDLILKFGKEKIRNAIRRFAPKTMFDVLSSHGNDFFMVLLHTMVEAENHLRILDQLFDYSPVEFAESVIRSRERFTGALLIMQSIRIEHFAAIVETIKKRTYQQTFIESFYKDPYLTSSAINIIAERDSDGQDLDKFLNYLPTEKSRSDLFMENLPGLVVLFSTIQEIKNKGNNYLDFGFFDLDQRQLDYLISHRPDDLALFLYSCNNLGDDNLKKLIHSIGDKNFSLILAKHTRWLAEFIAGLDRISIFSTSCDFNEIEEALSYINNNYSYLMDYVTYLPSKIGRVEQLFTDIPDSKVFLLSNNRAVQARVYLLGILAIYQNILYDHMPEELLPRSEFELLKLQILYSTRFSDSLNNMISNFEVGSLFIQECSMESIILFLAHELAHQIYSIGGFNTSLLSTSSIHECNSDIAAKAIAIRLKFTQKKIDYANQIFLKENYSDNRNINEFELISHNDPHIIGRTQLGYLKNGFKNSNIEIDWPRLFSVTISLLRDKSKIKNFDYIKDLVSAYLYNSMYPEAEWDEVLNFTYKFEIVYDTLSIFPIQQQIANENDIQGIIRVAKIVSNNSVVHK